MIRFLRPLFLVLLLWYVAAVPAVEPASDLPELSTVLSLFSAHAATDGVRLNWTLDKQSPTIVQFRIYRGYDEVGNFAVLSDIDVRQATDSVEYSFTDNSIRPGVSYFYKIAALGQKSESVFPVVITATPPMPGAPAASSNALAVASILPGEKIALYVRRAGHVKLEARTTPPMALVNDVLQPGIYEFDPPAKSLTLHLEHDKGLSTDITWPIP
jgi:hypothetical protein